ncbi:hypothetical protein PV328_002134 [Microctonus aethiopoides]|uniref:Uncharacterized protein n=1 Tax=Microctonus aethiopoides TaxID=144406 RepID=A0AA39FYE7_9HYME|nr:hypothetical protein PV328_002134 [Microctonus aethiopoides]
MKTIFIILICVACLIPILIGGGSGLARIFNDHCTSDTDCARSEKCSNNKCISACDGVSCGRYGDCQTENDHKSSCICGPKLKFNSSIEECVSHVITSPSTDYKFFLNNNNRYVQFYLKGNGPMAVKFVNSIPTIKEKSVFEMSITEKDITAICQIS